MTTFQNLNNSLFAKSELTKDESVMVKGGRLSAIDAYTLNYTDCESSGTNTHDCGDSSED
ncbi:MAG: hypothetical protein AAFP19_23840 [Bacteroidota bacterium]